MPLGQAGLLRPELVATALLTLYDACDKTGYVFSRTINGTNRFGEERLRKFFAEHDLVIGKLRIRLETDADRLGREGQLSATDRELVSYVLQHTPSVADADYVQREGEEDESEEEESSDEESSDSSDEEDHDGDDGGGGDGPDGGGDGGGHGGAPRRIDWVARVATHTKRLYDMVTNENGTDDDSSNTLIQLNMALAMASYNHLYSEPPFDEERTMVRHAGAACEFMNDMKRRRTE